MGWDRTAAYLGKKIKELGPFHGIMGFSQVSLASGERRLLIGYLVCPCLLCAS